MLFLPIAAYALAFIPRVGVPDHAHQGMPIYDGTTDLAVPRFGFSPSYDLSVARVGHTPSYALSVPCVGSTPSLATFSSAQCGDSTSSLEPRMCVLDRAEWNESLECAVSVTPFHLLFWLLSLCILVSIVSLHCLIAGFLAYIVFACGRLCAPCFLNLCAYLFRGLCTCLISGFRAFFFVGLCVISVFGCGVLVVVGCVGLAFAVSSMIIFTLIAVIVFNCFCGCAFVGHNGYNAYLKMGPRACIVLAVCLWRCFGLGAPLLAVICSSYYRIFCPYFSDRPIDNEVFINFLSGAGIWFGDVIGDFIRKSWHPWLEFSRHVLLCGSRFFTAFFFYGPFTAFFFYGVRPFVSHSTFF